MSEVIQIAIVDDHPFFREGVRRALRRIRDVKLVAQGTCAADACLIAKETRPDIILLDIGMPGGGIEAVRAIVGSGSSVKIVMLTGSDDDAHVAAALAAGANGYLLKGTDTVELVEALRAVHLGEPYITQALSSRLLVRTVRAYQPTADVLNHREQEIVALAAQGLTNSDIADKLGLALPTVKNYMSRILQKLQVRNRAEAVAVRLKK